VGAVETDSFQPVTVGAVEPGSVIVAADVFAPVTVLATGATAAPPPDPVLPTDDAAMWLRAADLAGLAGSPIDEMLDASGNGRSMSQGTAGARPTVVGSGASKAARFDGLNDFLQRTDDAFDSTYFTLAMRFSHVALPVGYSSPFGKTTNDGWGNGFGCYYIGGELNCWVNVWDAAQSLLALPTAAAGTVQTLVFAVAGDGVRLHLNGADTSKPYSSGQVNKNPGVALRLGMTWTVYNANIDVQQLVWWDRGLSADEVAQVVAQFDS